MSEDLYDTNGAGFPTNWFVGAVAEEFLCSICMDVMREPQQCKNGHCFCKACLINEVRRRPYCPVCKDPTTAKSMGSCLFVRQAIEKLPIHCPAGKSSLSKVSCKWQGPLSELYKHLTTDCDMKVIPCPIHKDGTNECANGIQICDLENHLLSAYCDVCDSMKHCDQQLADRSVIIRDLKFDIRKLREQNERLACGTSQFAELNATLTNEKFCLSNKNVSLHEVVRTQQSVIQKLQREAKQTCHEGLFSGMLVDSKKHGWGHMKYTNGDIYDGGFEHDVKQGHGRMKYADGTVYDGMWVDDRPVGSVVPIDTLSSVTVSAARLSTASDDAEEESDEEDNNNTDDGETHESRHVESVSTTSQRSQMVASNTSPHSTSSDNSVRCYIPSWGRSSNSSNKVFPFNDSMSIGDSNGIAINVDDELHGEILRILQDLK